MKADRLDLRAIPAPARRAADAAAGPRVQVAVINPDPGALATLDGDLRRRGFDVVGYPRPDVALRGLSRHRAEIALLDLRQREGDGLEELRRLREGSSLPVVVLTDSQDEVEEIMGLRLGADAVVRRPWSPRLLAERIRALSRRRRMETAANAPEGRHLLLPPLEIDLDRMQASWRGHALALTTTEFRLLHVLAERPGFVRTREFLMDRLYAGETLVLDRTVDSHVKRLRRKLRAVDPGFDAIDTLYGTGYRLTLPADPAARRA
jgi:two-component system response regulator ChvI